MTSPKSTHCVQPVSCGAAALTHAGAGKETCNQAGKTGLNLPRADEKSDDLEKHLIDVQVPLLLFLIGSQGQ